jgi:hypothetical protein
MFLNLLFNQTRKRMAVKRLYYCKDIELFVAAETIIHNFRAHKEKIVPQKIEMKDPYLKGFEKRADAALNTYLGTIWKKDLEVIGGQFRDMQSNALKHLLLFRIQLENNIQIERLQANLILSKLGYDTFWKSAEERNEIAFVQLLQEFRKGMNSLLKAELMDKRIYMQLIDNILSYADEAEKLYLLLESLRKSDVFFTDSNIRQFNSVCEELNRISIFCKEVFSPDEKLTSKFQLPASMIAESKKPYPLTPDINSLAKEEQVESVLL